MMHRMSVDKKKILQSEGLLAQHDAAEAGERAKNDGRICSSERFASI